MSAARLRSGSGRTPSEWIIFSLQLRTSSEPHQNHISPHRNPLRSHACGRRSSKLICVCAASLLLLLRGGRAALHLERGLRHKIFFAPNLHGARTAWAFHGAVRTFLPAPPFFPPPSCFCFRCLPAGSCFLGK